MSWFMMPRRRRRRYRRCSSRVPRFQFLESRVTPAAVGWTGGPLTVTALLNEVDVITISANGPDQPVIVTGATWLTPIPDANQVTKILVETKNWGDSVDLSGVSRVSFQILASVVIAGGSGND